MSKDTQTTLASINEVSRISSGSTVKGEVFSPGDIRIDGSFEGKIVAQGRVVVGEKAIISGDIICHDLDFWGKMTGNLYVRETLSLKGGSEVAGDVFSKRLNVELGCHLDGKCSTITDEEFEKLSGEVISTRAKVSVPPVAPPSRIKSSGKKIM